MTLCTRAEAAKHLRVSVRAFDAHVRPDLTPVRIGRRVLFRQEDLDAWVDQQKDGASDSEVETSRSDSRTRVDRSSSVQAPLTLSELRRLPRENIPRSYQEGAQRGDWPPIVGPEPPSAKWVRNG
jgi:hypothetical protein